MSKHIFPRLGSKQKEVIKLLGSGYHILKTLDTRDMKTTIHVQNNDGCIDRAISEKELQSLWNRGILLNADASMCLELVQEKFWLKTV